MPYSVFLLFFGAKSPSIKMYQSVTRAGSLHLLTVYWPRIGDNIIDQISDDTNVWTLRSIQFWKSTQLQQSKQNFLKIRLPTCWRFFFHKTIGIVREKNGKKWVKNVYFKLCQLYGKIVFFVTRRTCTIPPKTSRCKLRWNIIILKKGCDPAAMADRWPPRTPANHHSAAAAGYLLARRRRVNP